MIPGRAPRRAPDAWRGRHAARGLGATLVALATCLPDVATAGAPEPPDASAVVGAYLELRGWLDDFGLPPLEDEAARAAAIPGASGVCVVLRQSGRVVATGTDESGTPVMARVALGRALGAVLADPAVSEMPEALRDEVGRALTLELEVAGPLQPVLGRTYRQVADQLEPAVDGAALRRGRRCAMLFPTQLLATNAVDRAADRLPALAAALELPAEPLDVLGRAHGVSAYRFRTLRLAQREPRGRPFEATRGGPLVDAHDVSAASVEAFTHALAAHVLETLWSGDDPIGVRGDYQMHADAYEPFVAPPLEQALAALALSRYARLPALSLPARRAARLAADRIVRDLQAIDETEADPMDDPVACAAIVYALLDAPRAEQRTRDDVLQALLDRAAQVADATFVPAEGFVHVRGDGAERRLGSHGSALIAGALARRLVREPGSADPARVRAMLDAAWASAPDHRHVALLPWIAWGEADLAEATGAPLARVDDLRALLELLDACRHDGAGEGGGRAADLAGGFRLTGPRGDRPTAQTARPAAFEAWALREPRLVPADDALGGLGRHLRTVRFLMQLAVRTDEAWAVRNERQANGGIRAATWRRDLPAAAQSMTLLAAVETILSMRGPDRPGEHTATGERP